MPVPLLFTDHMTVTVWSSSYSNILFTSFHSAYNHTGRPIVFTFLHSIVLLPPPRAAVYKPCLYFMKVGQHPLLMRDWEAPGGPNPILRKIYTRTTSVEPWHPSPVASLSKIQLCQKKKPLCSHQQRRMLFIKSYTVPEQTGRPREL